ncbi:cytochrome C [Arsenicibacter rosenii]|uniref:Cytochrome C n=2 Tax=Arsenicibacter rosenii TaxID=1750698 RepID=A0A1S2VKF4_9BACT|nr:cytochrome C [Arsenicibacter rosenii]
MAGKATAKPITTAAAYSADKTVIARGQALFQATCTTCHNFRQKGIGPNLAGITGEMSGPWITAFIRNAPEVIKGGDVRGLRLFKEYNQYMPAFPDLSESDLSALLAYLHQQPKPKAETADARPSVPDPIPARIQKSGLRVTLTEVTTAPATAKQTPLARITKMLVLPGANGLPDRQFVVDIRGLLYEMKGADMLVFMDMAKERPAMINSPGLGTGFGSFAFHPDFYRNGLLYTSHTEKAGAKPADFAYADSVKVALQWVVTEWKMTDPASPAFAGTGRELFRVNMVASMHGMQELTFNPLAKRGSPDYGLLYIGIGDGGCTENGFPFICRDKSRIWSSVLRIDPLGNNSKNGQYGIPASNPYMGDGDPATADEVYCRGFRNPNRICWAPDGKMLISDIGQTQLEELNLGIAGADYGWPEREGTYVMNYRGKMDKVYALPANDRSMGYIYPVAQYDHDEGNAFSGGFVYAGKTIPLLTGKYVFGDIVNGRVYYVENRELAIGRQAVVHELDIELNGKLTSFRELTGTRKTDFRIGQGLNQELYFFTKTDGKIYKVTGCSK